MPADQQRANEIVREAAKLPNLAERNAYVEAECASSPELLQRVRELLAESAIATGVDDSPGKWSSDWGREAGSIERVVAGRYKLLQKLGEGGMGEVWMAEQTEPVRRKVAVKIIKAGMGSAQVMARFEAERQALALMDPIPTSPRFSTAASPATANLIS